MIVTGCDLKGSRVARELATWQRRNQHQEPRQSRLYFTAAVHPHSASTLAHADGTVDEAALRTIEELARSPLCVSVGECGLDYDRMFSPRVAQLAAFDAQLTIAAKMGRPVFVHIRETSSGPPLGAYTDALDIMKRHPSLPMSRVCVHCFTGSEA